jgi:hypothetical protein
LKKGPARCAGFFLLRIAGLQPALGRRTLRFRSLAKSHFRKGGESLRGFVANPQVCPTFAEMTFGNCISSAVSRLEISAPFFVLWRSVESRIFCDDSDRFIFNPGLTHFLDVIAWHS